MFTLFCKSAATFIHLLLFFFFPLRYVNKKTNVFAKRGIFCFGLKQSKHLRYVSYRSAISVLLSQFKSNLIRFAISQTYVQKEKKTSVKVICLILFRHRRRRGSGIALPLTCTHYYYISTYLYVAFIMCWWILNAEVIRQFLTPSFLSGSLQVGNGLQVCTDTT